MVEWEFDLGAMAREVYPQIMHNENLPQEIRDSWLQVCAEENVEALYN